MVGWIIAPKSFTSTSEEWTEVRYPTKFNEEMTITLRSGVEYPTAIQAALSSTNPTSALRHSTIF